MLRKKVIVFIMIFSVLISMLARTSDVYAGIGDDNTGISEGVSGTDISLDEYEDIAGSYSVDDSILQYKYFYQNVNNNRPEDTYIIEAKDYIRFEGIGGIEEPSIYENYEGIQGSSVYTDENGLIEFEVDIKNEGLYDLSVLYYPVKGKNSAIQRSFFVDGQLQYSELALVEFQRVWVNSISDYHYDDNGVMAKNWLRDNQGNDLKPSLIEEPCWITSYLYDSVGFVTDELPFYLTEGKHIVTIVSVKEPMLIKELKLSNTSSTKDYNTVKADWERNGVTDTNGKLIRIEAENADRTSSQMLYPMQDQSSPATYPSSAKELKNNTIGGNSWRLVGQWLEWDFEVEEDGYYNISMYAKQNYVKGIYVSRKISIDGNVPFEELKDYGFTYSQNWRLDTLQDNNGDAFKFYLEKGSHTIRMQVVLGEFSTIVSDVQDAVKQLNAIYRKVLRITGVSPDIYQDYQLESNLPELEDELIVVRDTLLNALNNLRKVAGRGSNKEAVLITMIDQLSDLIKDQERFVKVLGSYKINVRACGNWISQVLDQPLRLDTIFITSPDTEVKISNDSFWSRLFFELKRLIYSFMIDYNQIGNVADESKEQTTLTLWVGSGRDQANVIKSMIDESFTKNNGINVNVMLVDMSTLLQATLAGQGPDIAIQVGREMPMNYGLRNAVADLSQFADLEEIKKRFDDSAMVPYEYNEHTYALPETQTFPVMFYRKDIIKELGIKLPKTWDDVKVIMSVLSKNQMEFAMLPSEQIFAMLLYQNGGEYYIDDGKMSGLDSEEAIRAFKEYCEYYTDYKLDKVTSVEERFRTGEAPIIIADYSFYNTMQVSAPDLKGLWGFARVPGTVREDGSIDYSVPGFGSACVIMEDSKEKEAGWEFLKWWTSVETQMLYSREMESLMGASARVATANLEAFKSLPWPKKDHEALLLQYESVKGIPQVPGGYFTYRNVDNAFYRVTVDIDTATPREELMDNVIYINDEINFKRREFSMPLAGE